MKTNLFLVLSLILTMGLFAACDDDSSNNSNVCTDGETQNGITVCGLNDEGVYVQNCVDGAWVDSDICTGTDVCTGDATQVGETPCNDTGFLIQDCTDGQWVDSANCTVGGCTADATQVGTTVCGLNDEGFFVQLCNAEGTWDDTTECTGTDICVNGSQQDGTTVCNDTGVLIQDCTDGQWVDSANCTVGGCTEDATQVGTTMCGLNDEGFFIQLCNASGTWDDTTDCTGTDECVNGTQQDGTTVCNGTGVLVQDCTNGAWVDSATCTVGGCTVDATQVGTTMCGLNDEGFFIQLCNAGGTWDDTTDCTGTDICVNTTTSTLTCGDGNGVQNQTCESGAWVDTGSCVCNTDYYWDGATCAQTVTIGWCDTVAPTGFSGTVGAPETIYGQVYGTIGGTQVTASGTPLAAIAAQVCYDNAGTEVCLPAAYNPSCASCGNNDEYMTALAFTSAGTYDYYYQFSGDGGTTWTTCDTTYTADITGGSGTPIVIITEIVDGDLSGGTPKFFELTNIGTADADLADYYIGKYSNGGTTATILALSGTLAPGESYVVASEATVFATVYTTTPDLVNGIANNNGDDVVALYLAADDSLVDIYGVIGVNGDGEPWDYTDGYAYRLLTVTAGNPTFTAAEWSVHTFELDTLDAAGHAAVTTPGTR